MDDKDFLYKDELLHEALKEFADKGFDSASLNQIIKRSGISKGSFYHHFNNKEGLFYSVVQRVADEKLAFIKRWVEQKGADTGRFGFFETLQFQMEGGIEFALQHPELSQFFISILKNPELRSKAEELAPEYYDQVFETLVQEAVRRGELRSDMNPDFIKKFIKYSFMNLGDVLWDSYGDELDRELLEEQTAQFLNFMQFGLRNPDHRTD